MSLGGQAERRAGDGETRRAVRGAGVGDRERPFKIFEMASVELELGVAGGEAFE
jgi:hypothetical protein